MRILKNRKNSGFTLAETLLAVIILLLVSALLAQGIPLAVNAYKKVTLAANANTLISTTMTELRDKLAFSTRIEPAGDSVVFLSNNGRVYSLAYDADAEGLYLEDTTNDGYSDSHLLVSDPAAAKELCVLFSGASYKETTISGVTVEDRSVLIFSDLSVFRKSEVTDPDFDFENGDPLVSIDTYEVRLLCNGEDDE